MPKINVAFCASHGCVNEAKLMCARCNVEFYCSRPCQIRAFPEHRFSCFELPSLRSLDLNDTEDLQYQPSLLKGTKSEETAMVSEAVKTEEKALKAQEVKAEVPQPKSKQLETPKKAPEAPVVSKPASEAPKSAPEVKEDPKPTREVQPEKPKPDEPKEEPQRSNTSIISNMRFPRSRVPQNLVPTQAMKPKEPTRPVANDLKVRPLPTKPFKAVLLEGDPAFKEFKICELENNDYLAYIGTKVADYIAKTDITSHKPKKEELVLAKFEGTFYRGVVKEKLSEGYNVSYIDYGNSEVVKEEDMRPIDKSLMFDVITHTCVLENFPDVIDDAASAILEQEGIPIENIRKVEDVYVGSIVGL